MALFKRKRKPAGPDYVRDELEWILDHAWGLCLTDATLTAARLHERVCSDRDAPNDLMPTCISVMRGAMRPGDESVGGERKSEFAVRYRLETRRPEGKAITDKLYGFGRRS